MLSGVDGLKKTGEGAAMRGEEWAGRVGEERTHDEREPLEDMRLTRGEELVVVRVLDIFVRTCT